MKFKLIAGSHVGEDGKTYKAKDKKDNVVESDKDLVVLFPNKFQRVGEPVPAEDAGVAATSLPDADKPSGTAPTEQSAGDGNPGATTQPERDGGAPALGEDVTANHPAAVDADLMVFKATKTTGKGKRTKTVEEYHVAEADDPGTAINEKPLTADQVNEYLKEQVKE